MPSQETLTLWSVARVARPAEAETGRTRATLSAARSTIPRRIVPSHSPCSQAGDAPAADERGVIVAGAIHVCVSGSGVGAGVHHRFRCYLRAPIRGPPA